jgi:ribosomal protein L40E
MVSVWTAFLSRDAMPANRPNLTLDQQFLQELLSAAYTIQEHNDRLSRKSPAPDVANQLSNPAPDPEPQATSVCPHCGVLKPASQTQCARCGPDEFRPGERMQRKWASMWLMSQQQGLWPEASQNHEVTSNEGTPFELKRGQQSAAASDSAPSGILAVPFENKAGRNGSDKEIDAPEYTNTMGPANGHHGNGDRVNGGRGNGDQGIDRVNGKLVISKPLPDEFEFKPAFPSNGYPTDAGEDIEQEHEELGDSTLTAPRFHSSASDNLFSDDISLADESFAETQPSDPSDPMFDSAPVSLLQRIADWRVKLRFHRADVYLGTAIFVAALALLWPTAGSSQQATLNPWERALVTLGIAEAPQPVVHLLGDPTIEVWIDPHSALYYCPGEEQYGKTADGRFTSQREAQTDRFEPAGRSACE